MIIRFERLPFVLLAMLSLIVALLAGLQRIGWNFQFGHVSSNHGAIMVGGFLGTLISLEKIVPLKKTTLFIIPVLSGTSVILFFCNLSTLSLLFLAAASVGLSIVFLMYWLRERTLIYALMLAGSICWLVGNVFLIQTGFYPISIPWWIAFVLLIISSERLELMKFMPVTNRQKALFVGLLGVFIIGCAASFHGIGRFVAAASLFASGIWLMRYDIAGINLRKTGLPKYVGTALLCGYFSLLLSGVFIAAVTDKPLGYDILVHSFFIGFVFSMIFAHGPIILPGVLGISAKPYHPMLYLWLMLLHTSWVTRVIADIMLDMLIRKYSGLISAVAIVGYLVSLATLLIRTYRAKSV
jgi:hypothetical protein